MGWLPMCMHAAAESVRLCICAGSYCSAELQTAKGFCRHWVAAAAAASCCSCFSYASPIDSTLSAKNLRRHLWSWWPAAMAKLFGDGIGRS